MTIIFFLPSSAHAACGGPAGVAGEMTYDSAHNTMVYCNGSQWVSMTGSGGGSGLPTGCAAGAQMEWDGSAWTCEQDGGGGSPPPTCSDPTAGMTATNTYTQDTTFAAISPYTGSATLHMRVTFGASPSGVIFETGGATYGAALWADSSNIYFAAGSGTTTVTNAGGVVVSTPIADYLNSTVDIVVAVNAATGEAAIYVDDCWQASDAATGGSLAGGYWGGADAAGYGLMNSAIRSGPPTTAFNGTLASVLTHYAGQLPSNFPDGTETKVVFLTSGSSWTVPSDWNSADNSIEVIGGGGGGGGVVGTGGAGGGGGAYSRADDVSLTPGATVTAVIGTGGTTGVSGGDTYLCNATSNCASIAGSAVVVGAKGGGAGGLTSSIGIGGAAASGVGATKYSGGNGGIARTSSSDGGGGGGGAAGPGGAGKNGGDIGNHSNDGGAGGGGAGGGSSTAGQSNPSDVGGAGGQGPNGTGGGVVPGGDGSNGGGGAGGSDNTAYEAGGDGGAGTEWDATHGAGGGGGGTGGGSNVPSGSGGLYGGGGAGASYRNNGQAGPGAQGLIVITYTVGGADGGGGGGGSGPSGCPVIGNTCSDGSKFAGDTDMYVTDVNQANGGIVWYTAGEGVNTGADSTTDGAANQAWIVANATLSQYPAFQLCENLNRHGQTDWYLPSQAELGVLHTNRAAIGGFASDLFWSSTEHSNAAYAWAQEDDAQFYDTKDSLFNVRCVRRP